jgi:NADH-quinone oxidoreductase subunit J
MVYAGGVMVLLLFGVMTSAEMDKDQGPLSKPSEWISGFGLAAVLFFVLAQVFLPALKGLVAVPTLDTYLGGTLVASGQELLTNNAAPFEFAAFLLLLALAGAAPLAAGLANKKDKEK